MDFCHALREVHSVTAYMLDTDVCPRGKRPAFFFYLIGIGNFAQPLDIYVFTLAEFSLEPASFFGGCEYFVQFRNLNVVLSLYFLFFTFLSFFHSRLCFCPESFIPFSKFMYQHIERFITAKGGMVFGEQFRVFLRLSAVEPHYGIQIFHLPLRPFVESTIHRCVIISCVYK